MSMSATVERRERKTVTTWRVVVYKAGKRRRFTFATEREARATAATINRLDKAADGWLQDDGILMTRDVLLGWLEKHRGRLSQSYEVTAAGLVEQYLIPHFGCIPLAEINQDHLYAFVVKVYEAGKSGALALNALSILRRACQLYVEAGLLSANPAARCGAIVKQVGRRHETEVKRASAWTRAEVDILLELARTKERHVYGPLLCAIHTGMRRGEILGLEWRDVGPRRIAVERAWVRSASKAPKSGSARDIPISAALRAELEAIIRRNMPGSVFKRLVEQGALSPAPTGDK